MSRDRDVPFNIITHLCIDSNRYVQQIVVIILPVVLILLLFALRVVSAHFYDTYVHTCVQVRACVCKSVHVRVFESVCARACVRAQECVCMHKSVCVRACVVSNHLYNEIPATHLAVSLITLVHHLLFVMTLTLVLSML